MPFPPSYRRNGVPGAGNRTEWGVTKPIVACHVAREHFPGCSSYPFHGPSDEDQTTLRELRFPFTQRHLYGRLDQHAGRKGPVIAIGPLGCETGATNKIDGELKNKQKAHASALTYGTLLFARAFFINGTAMNASDWGARRTYTKSLFGA